MVLMQVTVLSSEFRVLKGNSPNVFDAAQLRGGSFDVARFDGAQLRSWHQSRSAVMLSMLLSCEQPSTLHAIAIVGSRRDAVMYMYDLRQMRPGRGLSYQLQSIRCCSASSSQQVCW